MHSTTRCTKIIATIGPSSSDADSVMGLASAGADIFRLNFSHGSHETHRAVYDAVRAAERTLGRPLGVLADLQGPKIRTAALERPVKVKAGDKVRFVLTSVDRCDGTIPVPHREIFASIREGDLIFVDDGKIRFRCVSRYEDEIKAECLSDGEVKAKKGINLPGTVLPISALTEADRVNLQFALDLGVDWVALSFVQTSMVPTPSCFPARQPSESTRRLWSPPWTGSSAA